MKNYFIFYFLILTFIVKGQIPNAKPIFYDLNSSNNSIQNHKTDYKNYFAKTAFYNLQIFNPTIRLFENYNYVSENQFERSDKMIFIYAKTPLVSSNVSSFTSPFFSNKPDSFNPSGATDFKSALGIGLINLLLNKNEFFIQR